MESGNSSSMQSSSGGDDQDQYDESSGGVIGSGNYFFSNTTARINNSSTNNTNTNTNPLPTQYHQHHDHQNNPDMFMGSSSSTHQIAPPPLDPPQHHGNFLEPFENHQPNFQNLMFWQTQQFSGGGLVDSPPVQNQSCTITPNNSNNQQKPSSSNTAGAGGSGSGSGKNPRKRTRASRRAPTTVLTTDTSNFRAMVQEFTGIPSSPFSAAASPLLSRRLTDLLAGPSSVGPSLRPGRPPSMMGVGPSSSTLERILAIVGLRRTTKTTF